MSGIFSSAVLFCTFLRNFRPLLPPFPCRGRLKNASSGGKIVYNGSCSVVAFEDLYVRATQVAQALPTVERTMRSNEERCREARARFV